MRKRFIGLFMVLVWALAGCNSLPATVVVVVTNTPDPNVVQVTITPAVVGVAATAAPTKKASAPTAAQTLDITPLGSPVPATNTSVNANSPAPTDIAAAGSGAAAATSEVNTTPSTYPTETRASLYIAQQDFEHGYMFWISTKKVIWVLFTSKDNPNVGEWQSFPDNWIEGTDPEIDPSLTPGPDQYQPRRGFGKLWRTEPGIREALGWGKTPEFALNTVYAYQPSAVQDKDGKWVLQPGKHFITSLSRERFALSETADPKARGKWERVG